MRRIFVILAAILTIGGVLLVMFAGGIKVQHDGDVMTVSFWDALFGSFAEGVFELKGEPKLTFAFIATIVCFPFALLIGLFNRKDRIEPFLTLLLAGAITVGCGIFLIGYKAELPTLGQVVHGDFSQIHSWGTPVGGYLLIGSGALSGVAGVLCLIFG